MMQVRKKLSKKVGNSKTRMLNVLSVLLDFLPTRGTINWNKDQEINGERCCVIGIGSTPFMANVDPVSPKVKVERREFWNNDCQEYIVSYDNGNYILQTTLDRSLPRDAKWLDARR